MSHERCPGESARVAASDLAGTALRPPIVTGGEARGYQLSERLRPFARVTRADVARALVDQLVDRSFIRAAPFVLPGGPSRDAARDAAGQRLDDPSPRQ